MSAATLYCATCGAANPADAVQCFACGNPPQMNPQYEFIPAVTTPSGTFSGALSPQRLLKQRYHLLRQVGKGGFGAVYQAQDTSLGNRLVAVKEMGQRGLTPEELREATENFQREALLLASLHHPNLPHIYEQFDEDGRWYLVMEFIEGETLETRLSRAPAGLPIEETLQIGLQLSKALGYLHSRQPPIIFRDLKPANIMLTPEGQVYLIDFGIARLFKPGQTKDTEAFGSAGYAAPEQYGKAQTTAQSDIYGLGATLYHLLSGDDPSNHPFLFKPLHLPTVPALAKLITWMLEQDQTQRPADMPTVEQTLQHIADELATGQKWASSAGMSSVPQAPLAPNPLITPYQSPFPSYAPLPQVMTAAPGQPNYLSLEEMAIIAYATQDVPHKDRLATLNDWQRTLASQPVPRASQRAKDTFIAQWTIAIIVLLIIALGILLLFTLSSQ